MKPPPGLDPERRQDSNPKANRKDSAMTEGPNADLFVQVLAQIEREPASWDQDYWATESKCGTAYCFAGWAVQLAEPCELRWWDSRSDRKAERTASDELIADAACRVLGTDDVNAYSWLDHDGDCVSLFTATNTLDDLYRISADILGIDETVLRDKVAAEVADGVSP